MQLKRAKQPLFTQKHIGLHIADTAHGHDPVAQNPFEVRNIARDNPQAVIITPQHMLNGLHLRDGRHRTLEIL